jgi:hypothetical protein
MKEIACAMLIAALVPGCSKEDTKLEPAAAAKPADAPPAGEAAKPGKPRAPAIDARLKPHFEAGKDCKWNEYGLANCDAATAIHKLAFENQSDPKLAASCAGALAHEDAKIRGLAAECMGGFNDRARIPHLAAGLDAFEAEKSRRIGAAIARAFSNGNAKESGVEDRVIALVRKLAQDPKGEISASYLIDSMFPSYLLQKTRPPSRAAGDLAMEMARKKGPLGHRATVALGKLHDRGPEVCKVLAGIARGDDWAAAVESMSQLEDTCADSFDPVVDRIAGQLKSGQFGLSEYAAIRQLLRRATLKKAHIAKLRKASRARLKRERKTHFAKSAKDLAAALKDYAPPER